MESDSTQSANKPTIAHLTPDRILDIAYSVHVLADWAIKKKDDPSLVMHEDVRLARRGLNEFGRLMKAFPKDSPEHRYLSTMDPIIVSLARGITRSKKAWMDKKRYAEEECDRRIMEAAQSSLESSILQLVKRYLFIGGFGFALAKAFIPWLDIDMVSKSQPNYLSLAFAGGLVLLSGYIKTKLDQIQAGSIYAYHNYLIWYANKEYSLSVKIEYKRAEDAARRAWKLCTGKEAPKFRGYDEFITEHLLLEDEYRRHCTRLTASPWKALVMSFVERAQKAWRKRQQQKSQPSA